MTIADNSHRFVAAAIIAVVHGVGVYMLMTFAPQLRKAVAAMPVAVRFITEERSKQWEPPEVRAVTQRIDVDMPQAPQLDVAIVAPPTDRAITVPTRPVEVTQVAEDSSVPRLVEAVEYVREPVPRYPPQSRRLREQGLVVLRVLIDERGTACDIEVETSSGYARLDNAAREAVERAAFRPYVEGGAPRRALVLIPIEFALNRSAA